jgi:prophage regulatory protein
MSQKMLKHSEIWKRRAKSRSSHLGDIKAGLFVKPVLIGLRAVATPETEVDTLISAQIAGKSAAEIRDLVIKLHAARKVAV